MLHCNPDQNKAVSEDECMNECFRIMNMNELYIKKIGFGMMLRNFTNLQVIYQTNLQVTYTRILYVNVLLMKLYYKQTKHYTLVYIL